MADVGIVRFSIIDEVKGPGSWRFKKSKRRWPVSHRLYREAFNRLDSPLLPDERIVECTRDEFVAGYDYDLGIDVILTLENQTEMTLQEKFLYTSFCTVTVEYMQNPDIDELGDWFKMKAQLYFVGYDRQNSLTFQEWILLNWSAVQIAAIPWLERRNGRDGAKASFRYAEFVEFPMDCVMAINACNHHRSLSGSPKLMLGLDGSDASEMLDAEKTFREMMTVKDISVLWSKNV